MKNKIYIYIFTEFLSFFLVILFTLTAIVWTIQAVNFLELVTEDGHAFSVFFLYSILGLPKTIARLIPFTFLVAITLTILKLEKDNELIVLWTSGLNKMKLVNIILVISFLITFTQLILATSISPFSLNQSRAMLKSSDLKLFPSLLKEKKFNDTVKNLTVFVEEKHDDGTIKNIFLRDDTKKDISQTISAQRGYIKKDRNSTFLILYTGIIEREKLDGQINSINFDTTTINLSTFSTKTITWPKVQEKSSIYLLSCALWYNKEIVKSFFINSEYIMSKLGILTNKNCYKKNDVTSELNRRFGMPLYIPLLSLMVCYLLSSRNENRKTDITKYFCFFIGFFILVFAEIALRYSGKIFYITILYYILPLIILIINYLILFKIFKYENLRS